VTGNTGNSYQVVIGVTGATLDGFTITGGYASGPGTANYGGGLYNAASDPVLKDDTFSGNWAGYGGGMFNDFGSKPTLTNVNFNHNSAANQGGGLFSQGASIPALANVMFNGNSSNQGGGMFNHNGSNATLMDVIFSENVATDVGGGMLNQWSSNVTWVHLYKFIICSWRPICRPKWHGNSPFSHGGATTKR
jgi:predicted outer membrane repeat protein